MSCGRWHSPRETSIAAFRRPDIYHQRQHVDRNCAAGGVHSAENFAIRLQGGSSGLSVRKQSAQLKNSYEQLGTEAENTSMRV